MNALYRFDVRVRYLVRYDRGLYKKKLCHIRYSVKLRSSSCVPITCLLIPVGVRSAKWTILSMFKTVNGRITNRLSVDCPVDINVVLYSSDPPLLLVR